MKEIICIYLPSLFIVSLGAWLLINPLPLQVATEYIKEMGKYGEVAFVLLLVTATVFAPVTVLPIIPIAATIFGPFKTGLLSVIGWTLGASIAFYFARVIGRPLLEKITNIEKIDSYVKSFPERTHFWVILLLRNTVPVDVLSYALGSVKSISFKTYFFATMIGVSYFSFALAYAGEAFFDGRMYIFLEIVLVSVAILLIGWYVMNRIK